MKQLLLILIALISFNCKKDETGTNPPSTTDLVMPLKVGNLWLYTITEYDTLGQVVSTGLDTFKLMRDTTIASDKWYIPKTNNERYANRSDGLYVWVDWESGEQPFLAAKFPANVGDTYPTGDNLKYTATVESKSVSITVPKGTYSCYKYRLVRQITSQLRSVQFYSTNTGLIKYEGYSLSPGGTVYLSYKQELNTVVIY